MKSSEKNIKDLDLAFEELFGQETDYETQAKVLASKILSEISTITENRELTRKNVAELIGTSASYITQLYRGTKLLNLITLVKLKDKLDLDIEISIKDNSFDTSDTYTKYFAEDHRIKNDNWEKGWRIYINQYSEEVAMTAEALDHLDITNKSKTLNLTKEPLIA